jgi:hypothetical protein
LVTSSELSTRVRGVGAGWGCWSGGNGSLGLPGLPGAGPTVVDGMAAWDDAAFDGRVAGGGGGTDDNNGGGSSDDRDRGIRAGDGWGVDRGSEQATGPLGVSPATAGGGTVSDGAADGNVVRGGGGGTDDGNNGDGSDG